MGLGLGYLLYKMQDQPKLPLNPMAMGWIWALAFLVGCLVVYGLVPYQKGFFTLEASLAERAIYGGFHRLAWALALSWVILACIKGFFSSIFYWLEPENQRCRRSCQHHPLLASLDSPF